MIIIVCQSDPSRAQLHNLFIITIRSAHHYRRMLFAVICDIFGLHVNLANKLQATHFFIPPNILLRNMTVISSFNSTPDIFSHNFSIRNLTGATIMWLIYSLDSTGYTASLITSYWSQNSQHLVSGIYLTFIENRVGLEKLFLLI